MRKAITCIALATSLCAPATVALATADPPSVCITGYRIDHTTIVDDQTILFVMNDRTVYRNRLTERCFGLKAETNGFTYEPTDPGTDELCSNLMTIRLNSLRSTCLLGAFEKLPAGTKG